MTYSDPYEYFVRSRKNALSPDDIVNIWNYDPITNTKVIDTTAVEITDEEDT